MEDLDRSIETKELALASTSPSRWHRTALLNNLGHALKRRFEKTGSMRDIDRAIEVHKQGAEAETAPRQMRLKAAQSCVDLLIGQRK
jgi:hypothetical protein